MARPKSSPSDKASRSNVNATKEQTNPSKLNVPDVEAAAEPAHAPEMKSAPEPRRLEVVKTESRKNANTVVPINLEDEIRRRAYELFLQRGTAPGSEAQDWAAAEREVLERYHQRQSA